MPKFYAEAAKVLKPGGTLALWTRVSFLARGIPGTFPGPKPSYKAAS